MGCDRGCRRTPISSKEKQELVAEVGSCENCDSYDDLEVDHATPRSRGGCECYDNLWVLCRKCNRHKFDMTYHEFYESGVANYRRMRNRVEWLEWLEDERRKADAAMAKRMRATLK